MPKATLVRNAEQSLHGLDITKAFSERGHYLNFELSWLAFNWRVFEEAREEGRNPLVDRIQFLAITGSNLDEFFQKRVGALKRQMADNADSLSVDGRKPLEQILAIREETRKLQTSMEKLLADLTPGLHSIGIRLESYDKLGKKQRARAEQYFRSRLLPILTPLLVDPSHPFPLISSLSLSLAVDIRDDEGEWKFVRIKIPANLPRFVALNEGVYVPVEQIVMAHLPMLLPGAHIESSALIRVTRDVEGDRDQESSDDLLDLVSEELRGRKYAPVVRIQYSGKLSEDARELLNSELELEEWDWYACGFMGMADLGELTRLPQAKAHRRPGWTPQRHPRLLPRENAETVNLFERIRTGELLVHYPYHSFDSSYMEFLRQAARDPKVLAIKMTLYRSTPNWEGFQCLKQAAEAGKQVAVLVEVQARFDEQRNIEIARDLEDSGVHVTYGVLGLKTHCKTTLVVRQEGENLRTYVHVGTGNYNPDTARLYEDIGLYSCDEELGHDVVQLFNFLTGAAPKASYNKILVAPRYLRNHLREAILAETEIARKGKKPAWIRMKMNALEDPEMIQLLYQASGAGVKVDLIVRGVCRLIPGRKGVSENITVRSVIGRFLEHSRIYCFGNGGDNPRIYIGSGDLMRRNLNRRVEVLAPIERRRSREYLLDYLQAQLDDTQQAWTLDNQGTWRAVRVASPKGSSCHTLYMNAARTRLS